MRDSEVVAAIVAGDPTGLAEAYDRYAGPLHVFCQAMLREPADAADVVQDTFVIAAPRMSALRDPQRLRPWLYTVARNECLRRLRVRSLQAPLEDAPDVTDEAADVAADMEKAELRALVREALPGVGPAEQEVLDLQLRHGLAGSEVASVLGVSRNHAHALMSRARVQLETALGVLVVTRTGRQDCLELNAMLDGWDGRLTVLMRKRVNRHVERCAICSRRREQEMTPAMLLGMAPVLALPLAAATLPAALRDQVMRAVFGSSPAAVAHRAALGRTPYSFGHQGFPQPLHPLQAPWWQAVPVHFSAATGTATAAAAAAAVGVTLTVIPHHHPGGHHPGAGASVAAGGTTPATAGAVRPTTRGPGTPRASAVATAIASSTPSPRTPSPSEIATSIPAPPPESESPTASDSAEAGTLEVSPGTLDITSPGTGSITLTASGGPVDWSVSVPAGKTKKDGIEVTPTSGELADGDTITVSVTMNSATKPKVKLTFSPGGETVKIAVG
jgi:RNA polymerase sigma factor (sigma-70 family)